MRRRTVAARSKHRIVLAGIGTKGDLFPLLALGREMVSRGYPCDLLTNQGYEDLARENGLAFHAVTVAQTNNLVDMRDNLEHHIFPSYAPTFEYFQREISRGENLAVVNLDECSASNLMCELHGLPLCRVTLAPSAFNSVFRPAWPLNEKVRGPLAATYRRYRLPQIYERMERAPLLLGTVNSFRERFGLRPLERFSQINLPVTLRLGFFPEWFGPRQPDWPANLELVGFPLLRARGKLGDALEAFLQREGRPLVFTPGTGVVDVERFFQDAMRCCERLDRPGVFLSPHLDPSRLSGSGRTFHAPFVDLQLLLERSSLLVHHGGIGTTARALEAGVPQIIRSRAYDQPDNGDRIASLGVGSFFEPGGFEHDRCAQEVERLLGCAKTRERLAWYRADIARNDASHAAATVLERALFEPLSVSAAQ
jgi:rhamnosyltransferase subunit B